MKYIFRKPKFMRNDMAMQTYMQVAETISNELDETKPVEEQYYYLKQIGECINKAAKAGGFLQTKDFIEWMELQKQQ